MLKKLHDFLRGNKNKAIINEEDYGHTVYYTYCIRVNSGIEDIDLIYKAESTTKDIIGVYSKIEFVGIYHKSQDTLYYSYLCIYNKGTDAFGTKMFKIDFIRDTLIREVKKRIIDEIGYDEKSIPNIKISDETLKEIKEDTVPELSYKLFMNEGEINRYEYVNSYTLPQVRDSETLLLRYLESPKKIIKSEVKKYLKEKGSHIAMSIVKNKLVEKKLDELSKNKNMIEKREIYTILNSKDMKTVNLKLVKDGQTLNYKVKTGCWDYLNCYVSPYDVVGKNKSEQFKKIFAETIGDASFDNISKITYSRNVLYERA